MNGHNGTRVAGVARAAGGLRKVRTADGREFLVRPGPETAPLLEVGAELGPREIERLEGPVAAEAGLIFAARFLARRERTEKQVREALAAAGIARRRTADHIIETLTSAGQIDDGRFAAELIAYRAAHRPAGPALISRTLLEAGVEARIVDEQIRRAFPPGEERRAARSCAARRLAAHGTGDRERDARRMGGFLARRGFSAQVTVEICAGIMRNGKVGETDERDRTDGA